VSTVRIKFPPFWTAGPELWFVQVESQFAARRITSDLTRYHHVVSSLPPATACEIRDLLLAPPAEEACKTPKETLIRRVTPSEPQRLQRLLHEAELGDRTPSQLLRHDDGGSRQHPAARTLLPAAHHKRADGAHLRRRNKPLQTDRARRLTNGGFPFRRLSRANGTGYS
ncbi:unnamed protein product, partial [Ixodes pacificus]